MLQIFSSKNKEKNWRFIYMSSLGTHFKKHKIILKYCLFYETIIILKIVYNMIIFIFIYKVRVSREPKSKIQVKSSWKSGCH